MSNSNDSGWSTYRRTCVGLKARFLARAGCGKSARPVRRGESGSGCKPRLLSYSTGSETSRLTSLRPPDFRRISGFVIGDLEAQELVHRIARLRVFRDNQNTRTAL